jgi:hypothetical protein
MENKLKSAIIAFLDKKGCCKFTLTLHHKGHAFELEYDGKQNEDCGDTYNTLEEWIGYGDFFEYLLDHGNLYNFEGIICINDKEDLKISVAFFGTYEDYEEPVYVNLDKSFLINDLGLNLSEIDIDKFDEEYVSLIFSIEKGIFISDISLSYEHDETININLNNQQQSILKKYILDYVMNNAPSLDVDFDCNQIIDAECDGNQIIYRVATSYINLNWNDIYPK